MPPLRRWIPLTILAGSGLVLVLFCVGVASRWFPLGVPGEWTWSRLPQDVELVVELVLIALAALVGYAGFGAWGRMALDRPDGGRLGRALWLIALGPAAAVVSVALQEAAPLGLGKMVLALQAKGSSGYYAVARTEELADLRGFVQNYPDWIARQDALHIGTHPPGLVVSWRVLLEAYRASPEAARAVIGAQPESVRAALRVLASSRFVGTVDQAALATVGWLILLSCAATCWAVYGLARALGSAPGEAWSAAVLWGVVPSVLLFQPTADPAFALPATIALALAAWGRPWSCLAAGLVMGVGMQFSLVFLAVGLVAGLVMASDERNLLGRRVVAVGATGLGFVVVTLGAWVVSGMNPFRVWWSNQHNHARFYEHYPRSWGAWQVANVAEVAVGLGLALVPWIVMGVVRSPRCRLALATVGVLAILQLSGRSLSEVARLWLPLFPPLVVAAAHGMSAWGARGWALAGVVSLMGVELLALQWTVQVVYSLAGVE